MSKASTSNDERFPWPSGKDRLFITPSPKPKSKTENTPSFDAVLDALKLDLGYVYREAYFDAGKVLAQALCENDRNWPLIYPMLFCFRHFVELSLKAVIEIYCKLLEQNPQIELAKEHGPMKLWNEAKRLINEAAPPRDSTDDTDTHVERCLNELNQFDKGSQLFRYPTDKKGESVENRLPRLDLAQFFGTMENLQALFQGCEMQAEHLIECRDDMREYYAEDSHDNW